VVVERDWADDSLRRANISRGLAAGAAGRRVPSSPTSFTGVSKVHATPPRGAAHGSLERIRPRSPYSILVAITRPAIPRLPALPPEPAFDRQSRRIRRAPLPRCYRRYPRLSSHLPPWRRQDRERRCSHCSLQHRSSRQQYGHLTARMSRHPACTSISAS
jgi:hypothetical protein